MQLIRNQQVEGSSPFTSSKPQGFCLEAFQSKCGSGCIGKLRLPKKYRGVAQLGERSERRRGRSKRGKASGRDLPSGELRSNEDRGLVTTGRARSAKKTNIGVWLSLVERLVRDQEVGCSNHLTPTK